MRCFRVNSSLPRGKQCLPSQFSDTRRWQFGRLRKASSSTPLFSSVHEASSGADGRVKFSQIWVPTGGIAESKDEDSHAKLIRAGYLRQAHSGIFHMLPLGRRVQEKLELLIDKHMYKLGASKVSLSSISSQALWSKSGRLANVGSELFKFKDRKDAEYLLSPTHEEEITSLVSRTVKSYKELPVRLYQISRKYRDERRPRHGLLRSREFIMKDLYTFDFSSTLALQTYHEVRAAYARLFDELKLPYLVAEADSGDIGGDLSHEFHFPTSKGEDHIISCTTCDYVANEELAEVAAPSVSSSTADGKQSLADVQVWRGLSQDRLTLVNAWYISSDVTEQTASSHPQGALVNHRAVKAVFPDLDASIDDPIFVFAKMSSESSGETSTQRRVVNLLDCSVSDQVKIAIRSELSYERMFEGSIKDIDQMKITFEELSEQGPLNLMRITNGDKCPRCPDGTLRVDEAVELGHTFHLGTRYSEPLGATVNVPMDSKPDNPGLGESAEAESNSMNRVPIQMGCHGIGVSRMIGAVAETLADKKGLNWPRVMAPYEVVIIAGPDLKEASFSVYDTLAVGGIDTILDDRQVSFGWKMKDADLIGYPVIVLLGKHWKTEHQCEVQCRRLKFKEQVPFSKLKKTVDTILEKL